MSNNPLNRNRKRSITRQNQRKRTASTSLENIRNPLHAINHFLKSSSHPSKHPELKTIMSGIDAKIKDISSITGNSESEQAQKAVGLQALNSLFYELSRKLMFMFESTQDVELDFIRLAISTLQMPKNAVSDDFILDPSYKNLILGANLIFLYQKVKAKSEENETNDAANNEASDAPKNKFKANATINAILKKINFLAVDLSRVSSPQLVQLRNTNFQEWNVLLIKRKNAKNLELITEFSEILKKDILKAHLLDNNFTLAKTAWLFTEILRSNLDPSSEKGALNSLKNFYLTKLKVDLEYQIAYSRLIKKIHNPSIDPNTKLHLAGIKENVDACKQKSSDIQNDVVLKQVLNWACDSVSKNEEKQEKANASWKPIKDQLLNRQHAGFFTNVYKSCLGLVRLIFGFQPKNNVRIERSNLITAAEALHAPKVNETEKPKVVELPKVAAQVEEQPVSQQTLDNRRYMEERTAELKAKRAARLAKENNPNVLNANTNVPAEAQRVETKVAAKPEVKVQVGFFGALSNAQKPIIKKPSQPSDDITMTDVPVTKTDLLDESTVAKVVKACEQELQLTFIQMFRPSGDVQALKIWLNLIYMHVINTLGPNSNIPANTVAEYVRLTVEEGIPVNPSNRVTSFIHGKMHSFLHGIRAGNVNQANVASQLDSLQQEHVGLTSSARK